ncbi:helix-turn-helix domain-containing protein [Micromonospora zamorensis]
MVDGGHDRHRARVADELGDRRAGLGQRVPGIGVRALPLSHHLKVLRAAGVLRVTPNGSFRRHELRADEINDRFPGLLPAIIANLDLPERVGVPA